MIYRSLFGLWNVMSSEISQRPRVDPMARRRIHDQRREG